MKLDAVASLMLPLVIVCVGLLMLTRRVGFDSFTAGARSGLAGAVKLLPTLVALLVAVRMLSACGAVELLGKLLSPLCDAIGVPSELLPLLVTRPISGSAATAAYSELLSTYGADSFPALCASVIMGSSDTAVYVITLYFSSVGIKRTRYALPVALGVMLFCIFFSCFLCRVCLK